MSRGLRLDGQIDEAVMGGLGKEERKTVEGENDKKYR
jgi:hypothetical protein